MPAQSSVCLEHVRIEQQYRCDGCGQYLGPNSAAHYSASFVQCHYKRQALSKTRFVAIIPTDKHNRYDVSVVSRKLALAIKKYGLFSVQLLPVLLVAFLLSACSQPTSPMACDTLLVNGHKADTSYAKGSDGDSVRLVISARVCK